MMSLFEDRLPGTVPFTILLDQITTPGGYVPD
jgi:hypothetical protein